MEILTLILNSLPYIIVSIILLGGVIALVLNQRKSVKQWLLLAVAEAEKALGSGTGRLKLRQVYQSFIDTWGIFAKFVTFETFEKWVDVSLDELKKLLETNNNIAEYVGVEKKDETKGDE